MSNKKKWRENELSARAVPGLGRNKEHSIQICQHQLIDQYKIKLIIVLIHHGSL